MNLNDFEKTNTLHNTVRKIVADELRTVLDTIPKERREDYEVLEGRYGSACEFLASVASLFTAYKSLLSSTPNVPALLKALNDLSFGFDTNQFYNTYRGYLHPLLMNSINTWLTSVDYFNEQNSTDTATGRFMVFSTQHAWLEIFPAAAFCLGGSALMNNCGKKLKDAVYRVI